MPYDNNSSDSKALDSNASNCTEPFNECLECPALKTLGSVILELQRLQLRLEREIGQEATRETLGELQRIVIAAADQEQRS